MNDLVKARSLIIFHADCPDGWGSAWWLSKALAGANGVPGGIELHAGRYGEPPPDCASQDVYVVDFCYPAEDLDRIASKARSLLVLDHHQTAVGYVTASKFVRDVTMLHAIDFPPAAFAVLDMEHSGVGMVSDYVAGRFGVMPPQFLANIQDRDLWRFRLKSTPAVFAAVTSYPYSFEAWDAIAAMPFEALVAEGEAICRYRDKLIEAAVETAFVTNVLGHDVWCAASPYAIGSDVAGELAKRDPELFAAYFVQYGDHRRFGLRSTPAGMDVAALAETVGGGGHRHAAGFEQPERPVVREALIGHPIDLTVDI